MSSVHTSLTALVLLLTACFMEHQVLKQVSMCIEHRRKLRALEGPLVLVTIDVYIPIIRSLGHLLAQGALDLRFDRMHQLVQFPDESYHRMPSHTSSACGFPVAWTFL